MRKYADELLDLLVDEGYTHCFFVAGGNIMHLLDSARTRFECIPVVHEVAAGIAVEYFNEARDDHGARAFAMVTAGPGLTNIVTAMAGAFLESRELLVIGGQVKSSDLAGPGMRQRGIQEIDGVSIADPVCVATLQIAKPATSDEVLGVIRKGSTGRKGPVFIEICLDAQAAPVEEARVSAEPWDWQSPVPEPSVAADVVDGLLASERPLLLLGGGIRREAAAQLVPRLTELGIPMATTWNGADRVSADNPVYFGRPNTWGMRWANLLIQQCDMLVALGTRLGMQQTGFNWQGFAPMAHVVQCDIDPVELDKGHPVVDTPICGDANALLMEVIERLESVGVPPSTRGSWTEWVDFGQDVRRRLPSADPGNTHLPGYLDPFEFVDELSGLLRADDVIVPCSSGGAFTVMMQAFRQQSGQIMITDKGLASMGYGLSGALGASIAHPTRRTILCEGDGGFSQNIQELGTVRSRQPNLKIFVFANEGYASIRMTQRNYFGGTYVGCDTSTGLGFPDWQELFGAFGFSSRVLDPGSPFDPKVRDLLETRGPAGFIVPIDPEQTYLPKISSRVNEQGSMESNPLHLMTPDLSGEAADYCMRYLKEARS